MHRKYVSILIFLLIMILFLFSEVSAGRYYSPKTGQFIQPDHTIPNVYNPQALNRYSYAYNNPYKYIDPTGKEPVLAQIGDYNQIYNQLQAFEASQGAGLSASQALSNLVSFQGRFNSQLGDRQTFLYDSGARYVYTSEAGFVDNLHFITAAAQTQKSGAFATRIGGLYVELRQLRGDPSSAFSYEDLSSNRLGIEFAGQLNDKDPLSTQYKNFIESKGGSTTPLETLNQQYPGLSANIPNKEPSGGPSFTRYSSEGKAIPKQGFIDRVKGFFSGGKK